MTKELDATAQQTGPIADAPWQQSPMLRRHWVSWWSGNYADEGCTAPPFAFWVSGQRDRVDCGLSAEQKATLDLIEGDKEHDAFLDENGRDDCSICAVVEAESETAVWQLVRQHFPDFEIRFCVEKPHDWKPSDRFPSTRAMTAAPVAQRAGA